MRLCSWGLVLALTSAGAAQPTFSHPDRVRYDGHCFTIDGKDIFIFSGAFHYFRCPKELWRQRFQKIKEAGFNAVETYVAWNWSEQQKPSGLGDTSHIKLTDLDEWLKMAEDEFGLYTIVRPGPYICSEWASGGYPNWLQAFRPVTTTHSMWYRSDDPVFEQWSRRWMQAVARVVDKHQLTKKPSGSHGVILWQVENEYDFAGQSDQTKRNYVKDLISCTKSAGIEVPIFTCWTSAVRFPKGDSLLSQAFDNPNEYPRWNIVEAVHGIDAQQKAQPWAPKMVTEFQGGWFGGVGGQAAEEQEGIDESQINALTLWSIANGLTGLNYYMLFGGTNFGDWAAQGITTSYDYAAPLREWGGVGAKYRVVKAIGKMLAAYGPDLARSNEPPSSRSSNGDLEQMTRLGKSGALYVFYWNKSRTAPANVDAGDGKNLVLPPFGANVFRYTSKPADGSWIVVPDAPPKAATPAAPIRLKSVEVSDLSPVGWRAAPENPSTTRLGIWDSRFISYRVAPPKGKFLTLRSTDSELVTDEIGAGGGVPGGNLYVGEGKPMEFVLFNPGWPNGGNGMEKAHGITDARLLDKLPNTSGIAGWRTKILEDQKDRSLAAEGVDTSSWTEGVKNDLFLPHTTGVVRATVDLKERPAADTVLNCGGVDDEGWFYVNGHLVGEVHEYNVPVSLKVGQFLHQGKNDIAIVIQNNEGAGGLTGAVTLEPPLPPNSYARLSWTDRYSASPDVLWGLDPALSLPIYEHPKVEGPRPPGSTRLVRSTLRFDNPGKGIWQIVLDGGGDGFLSLNGRPLGRYWEVGPQRGFYLPETWLKEHNVLELTVVPGRFGDRIKAAELRQLPAQE